MFTISGISNSFVSRAFYNNLNVSSNDDRGTSARLSGLGASDTVTLSKASLKLLEDLIKATGKGSSLSALAGNSLDLLKALYNSTEDEAKSPDKSSGSSDLLKDLLHSVKDSTDSSTGLIYNILISAQNQRLIKNNPELANMILSAKEKGSTDSSSSLISTRDDINLVTMSASEILKIIEKYKAYSSSATATESSSPIDETV